MKKLKVQFLAFAALVLIPLAFIPRAHAQTWTDLITDGDFDQFNSGNGPGTDSGFQLNTGTSGKSTLQGWVNISTSGNNSDGPGYNWVYTQNNSTFNDQNGTITMVNPALDTGSQTSYASAKTIFLPFAGYTGNRIAADGVYQQGYIEQTISSLTPGAKYDLTFYCSGGQQSGFTGPTSDWWDVTLGGGTAQSTTTISLAGSAISYASDVAPWTEVQMQFTATNSSELLQFLAWGSPTGEPPFSFLADVSLYETPEPSTIFAGAFQLAPVGLHASSVSQEKRRASLSGRNRNG